MTPSFLGTGEAHRRRTLAPYLKTPVGAWGDEPVYGGDVVLSSRARLARNLKGHPFPHQASNLELRRVAHLVKRAGREGGPPVSDLAAVAMAQLSARDLADLVNARRISPDLANGPRTNRFALLDENGALGVFVNEEDHLRIQTVVPGNAPLDALQLAQIADACFSRRLGYARDSLQWGFLTASLGNVGTGLRLSLLLHLPALQFLNRLNDTLRAAHVLGISVRAAHGEHSLPAGDLFQVSNAVTWGLTSEYIAGRVAPVADYLVAAERAARREVAETFAGKALEQGRAAWRAIENAERFSAKESLDVLSRLRLCAASGLDDRQQPDDRRFAQLLGELRTAASGTNRGEANGVENRDAIARPAKLRNALRPFWGD